MTRHSVPHLGQLTHAGWAGCAAADCEFLIGNSMDELRAQGEVRATSKAAPAREHPQRVVQQTTCTSQSCPCGRACVGVCVLTAQCRAPQLKDCEALMFVAAGANHMPCARILQRLAADATLRWIHLAAAVVGRRRSKRHDSPLG